MKVVWFFLRVDLTHFYAFHSFAYAKSLCLDMLTRCLHEDFVHKHAAGAYARGFFYCSNTQRAEDSDEEDEEDEEDEDAQAACKARCCRLLFAALRLRAWALADRVSSKDRFGVGKESVAKLD